MATSRKENGSLVRKAGKIIVDLVLNLASNRPIANSAVARQFGGLRFRDNDGTAQYSLDDGTTWKNFSGGAILIGTYSSNTTVDVSAYGATSASQFLLVPSLNASNYREAEVSTTGAVCYLKTTTSFTLGSLSLSNNTLTVTLPVSAAYGHTREVGTSYTGDVNTSTYVTCKLYYVGDVVSAS